MDNQRYPEIRIHVESEHGKEETWILMTKSECHDYKFLNSVLHSRYDPKKTKGPTGYPKMDRGPHDMLVEHTETMIRLDYDQEDAKMNTQEQKRADQE